MGSLYGSDLNKYKKYFKESAKLLGIDVYYRYIIKRNIENQSGESVYSKLSEPIKLSVTVDNKNPEVESLKQLGWFVDTKNISNELIVNFPIDTPNLQEGCRFSFVANYNEEQNKEYVIIRLSNQVLYPTHIVCLCQPILNNESTYSENGKIIYGQQDITSDTENWSYINDKPETTIF